MKKLLLTIACIFASVGIISAVPAGEYYDYRGNLRAIVSQDGKTIHMLDRNGYVTHELTVISENSDGSFSTTDRKTGISHPATKNAWFNSNGKICLNVEWSPRTLTRK